MSITHQKWGTSSQFKHVPINAANQQASNLATLQTHKPTNQPTNKETHTKRGNKPNKELVTAHHPNISPHTTTYFDIICAADVFPMPGGPLISTAFFPMSAALPLMLAPPPPPLLLVPAPPDFPKCSPSQPCSQRCKTSIACLLPTNSAEVCGLYLSTQRRLLGGAGVVDFSKVEERGCVLLLQLLVYSIILLYSRLLLFYSIALLLYSILLLLVV